jgi:uncharacterized protein YukE
MSGDVQINGPAGDPQALMNLADQLDQHATNVGNLGTNTLKTTQGIASAADWTGSAASAYGDFTGNTAHAVTGLESPLHNVANSIRTYAGVLKSAQQRVTDAVGTANNNIKSNPACSETEISSAQKTASDAQSEVDKAGEQCAGEVGEQESAFKVFMEKIETPAKINEWAHVPFDVAVSDAWLDKVLDSWKETAEGKVKSATQAQADLEKSLQQTFDDEVGSVAHDFDNGEASMEDVESAFAKYAADAKAATSAAADAVDTAETGVNIAKAAGAASKLMGGLAIVGDAMTIIKPEDSGAMGWVDRGAAAANAGTTGMLLALNATDEIPVWGEAVAVGTGLYLAGDFLYHNFKPFHDLCNTVGSGIATGAKAVASGVSSLAHTVASWF